MKIIDVRLKFNGEFIYDNVPNKIILHHTKAKNCSIENIHNLHLQNGWMGIGYHYFVGKDGSIYIGRPENAQGAHCIGQNTRSIGICTEGDYVTEIMPLMQKNALVELCKDICNRYQISEVGGHKEYCNTDCPGENYPIEEIRNLIDGKLGDCEEDFLNMGDEEKIKTYSILIAPFNGTDLPSVKEKLDSLGWSYTIQEI
jgi:N-acetyl-anhydromuramyl-L-alanine amidase AmpD